MEALLYLIAENIWMKAIYILLKSIKDLNCFELETIGR